MPKFYYFDNDDYICCGAYNSADEAREAAVEGLNHTKTVIVMQAVSKTNPPSLKRKWLAV